MNKPVKRRRVTISQVAAESGVARATAAFILSGRARELRIAEKTILRVEAVANRMGYIPNQLAKGLITGSTHIIGVVLGGVWGKFGQHAIEGIRDVLEQEGYLPFLTIHSWEEARERRELDTMLRLRVDGIIAVPQPTSRKEFYQPILRQGVPLVYFGDVPDDVTSAHVVAWNVRPAVEKAIDHLISMGRRRIGFIGERFFRYNMARYQAYCDVLDERGLERHPARETWLTVGSSPKAGWANALLDSRTRPDALLAMNDNAGLHTLDALNAKKIRIPEDIALICLGDYTETVESLSQLTAIREPVREMGRAAAQLVLQALSVSSLDPVECLVNGEDLVVRPSTLRTGQKST